MTDEQRKEYVASAEGADASDDGPGPTDRDAEEAATRREEEDVAPAAAETGGGGVVEVDADELEELRRKAGERATFLDELRRARAELDNYQKRIRRERPQWEERAVGRVLGDLLTVVDNFERALESIHADDERTRSIEAGVRMIYQLMLRVLHEHGVEEIPASGVFDPAVHEAMVEEEVEDRPTGDITSVLEKGYRLRTSVLRPSKVKVARNVHDTTGASSDDTDETPREGGDQEMRDRE